MNPRSHASQILHAVIQRGMNLDEALASHLPVAANDHAFIQALCYGVLRDWPRPQTMLGRLLHRSLPKQSELLSCLLWAALYELQQMNTPAYAAVSQTVACGTELGFAWAKGLINAVLRNALRQSGLRDSVLALDLENHYAHPRWMIEQWQRDWPQDWQSVLEQNNRQAPLVLRVNRRRTTRAAYLDSLAQAQIAAQPCNMTTDGLVLLRAVAVEDLPGFVEGLFSVQDGAAQLVAPVLELQAGQRVLDACAAPGGKTTHLLECEPDLELLALDNDAVRLQRVQSNLDRLGFTAAIRQADACRPAEWWDGQAFDRILLDVPCSASGVIRRHPDIKLLRRRQDLPRIIEQQQQMLQALWPLLKPGGMLLYTTCSTFVQENDTQVSRFLRDSADAELARWHAQWGRPTEHGRQILPGESGMDGFYYARLVKRT